MRHLRRYVYVEKFHEITSQNLLCVTVENGKILYEFGVSLDYDRTFVIEHRTDNIACMKGLNLTRFDNGIVVWNNEFQYRIAAMPPVEELTTDCYAQGDHALIGATRFGYMRKHYDTIYCRYCSRIFLYYPSGYDGERTYRRINTHTKKCSQRNGLYISIENIMYALMLAMLCEVDPCVYLPRHIRC